MSKLTRSQQAILFGLAAVFCWSTVATAFKIALSHLSPLQLVFVAVLSSITALGCILGYQRKLHLIVRQWRHRPLFYLQTGLLNPFLYYLVLFKAYDLLPAQQALSLNYTWAILLPLLSVPLLKQALKISDVISAVVAYFGVVVIATQGQVANISIESPLGLTLILSSTVIWCLYWIINTKDQGDPVASLLLSFLVGLPFITSALLVFDQLPSLNISALAAGIYVGLFEMGITFVLWLMALKLTPRTANISTLVFLSPVLSIGFISWILKEPIASTTYVGLGLILLGLVLQKLLPRLTAGTKKNHTKSLKGSEEELEP
ncbi:DMT family transporter [Shewanella gelidii]|uniref:Membrane protein n=1 Tax=Shewanella gelidii TaxID=1642821 RepID=A0A917N705_9GAMM|nr:DMT family transporter [Shewanella gelidii]MCL1097121.1 DMT family transporter [Shewanella gelidii]GGI72689.1 membrane protein [Shewanella gelidii]